MDFSTMNKAQRQTLLREHDLEAPLSPEGLACRLLSLELRLEGIEVRLAETTSDNTSKEVS
ncbi:hypothetical protein [Ellagibacter isourolithinifaciens]|jgi:hypothetical protein|uniref:hypothetical protein n=1 Tax=Ellagibacter isourolithinifaciens TaxID=2137581 RepID=UPI003AB009EE